MRLPGSGQVLEACRRRALTYVQEGMSLNAAARSGGLRLRAASGRLRRLTARREARLLRELLRGAHLSRLLARDDWSPQKP